MVPDRNITDPQLAKALAHPLRLSILEVLERKTASPSDIAEELGASIGVVSYHVRMLARLGLAKLVDTRSRRGALEHYYRAEERPVITSEAWEKVPSLIKQATVHATLKQLSQQVNGAARAGGFDRATSHLSRAALVLDERGWEKVASKLDRLRAELEEIAQASARRLAKSDHEDEISSTVVLMLFDSTSPAGGDPDATNHRRGSHAQTRRRSPA